MNTYQALYYPFIHFKDDGWLEVAALYWDRLARIVPQDYATDDSDTVRALSPCIDSIRPEGVLGAPTQAAFVDFVRRYAPALRRRHVGTRPAAGLRLRRQDRQRAARCARRCSTPASSTPRRAASAGSACTRGWRGCTRRRWPSRSRASADCAR